MATIIRPGRRPAPAADASPEIPPEFVAPIRMAPVDGVRFRRERFGGVVYVPRRDHFFALDPVHAALLRRMGAGGPPVTGEDARRAALLAAAGICRTEPAVPQRAFYGRSVLGGLDALPLPSAPLVVNCFATSYCPLRCRYCHADDLMVGYRRRETGDWLDLVIRTASATPAMVAVITGGEPLFRPDRARRLIGALAPEKALVLDTSGVGDIDALLPVLRAHGVHVRVSLDSADPARNDALRPLDRRHRAAPAASGDPAAVPSGGSPATPPGGPAGAGSYASAVRTLRRLVAEGVPCSVQTVITSAQDERRLRELRDLVVHLGVTTWVLHPMVPAGKGARPAQAKLLPGPAVLDDLGRLVAASRREGVPLDIRVTGTHRAPNAVLLINARGELCVEDATGGGKRTVPTWPLVRRRSVLRGFHRMVDRAEHASRYLNGTLAAFTHPIGAPLG